MVKRYNRLLVAFYVLTDALLASCAFLLAFYVRFQTDLIPITKGSPPLEQYVNLLPFVAILTPFAFHLQGGYRLRRGRSRVDDFFAVLVGTILAVVLAAASTLYVQAYFASGDGPLVRRPAADALRTPSDPFFPVFCQPRFSMIMRIKTPMDWRNR